MVILVYFVDKQTLHVPEVVERANTSVYRYSPNISNEFMSHIELQENQINQMDRMSS